MIAILALNQRNPLRLDPTRTTSIQKQFAAEMKRRFRVLRRVIFRLIVEEDAFGIKRAPNPFAFLATNTLATNTLATNTLATNTLATNIRFAFETDAGKVKGFQKWFKEQVDEGVLEIEEGIDPEVPWTSKHTTSAYQRGVTRAFIDAKNNKLRAEGKATLDIESEFFQGTKAQFLETAFSGSVGTAQVEMLATRSFEMLKDVTAQMSSAMSRELSSGFSQGFGARRIARNLDNAIAQIDRRRSLRIARTEIVHAHSEGQLDAFDQLGVEEVGIMAEFSTAGDDLVCFPAGTLVETETGLIPIQEVVPGMMVKTREGHKRVIEARSRPYMGEMVRITHCDYRVTSTSNHPFLTERGWIEALDLTIDDKLWCIKGLWVSPDRIETLDLSDIPVQVYDIQVEDQPEFYANGILVHNCPLCLPLEAAVFTVKEARGVIPRHPNCIVGETKIFSPNLQAIIRAKYTGDIVRVRTWSGKDLSVTQNHIFVTPFGNVLAQFLKEGMDLLNTPFVDSMFRDAPDSDHRKTCIADIFSAFSEFEEICSTPKGRNDLHGDGERIDSEIDIIRTDGLLWNKLYAKFGSKVIESMFPSVQLGWADIFLPGLGSVTQFLKRIAFATDSSMGLCRDSLAVLLGHLLHTENVGFGLVPKMDSVVFKSLSDDPSVTVEMLRDAIDTHPFLVHFQNFIDWDSYTANLDAIENADPSFFESVFDCLPLDTKELSDLVNANAIDCVHSDRIVEIERTHVVDLPVYDVATSSTLNIANGLIVVNCRCAFLPVIPSPISRQVDREQRESLRREGETRELLPIEREKLKGPKTSKSQIEDSIRRSIRAERPAQSRREAFRRSTSPLADRKISKSRAPKGTGGRDG